MLGLPAVQGGGWSREQLITPGDGALVPGSAWHMPGHGNTPHHTALPGHWFRVTVPPVSLVLACPMPPIQGVKTSLHGCPTSIPGPRTPHLPLILLRCINSLIYARTLKGSPTSSPPPSMLLLGPPKTLLLSIFTLRTKAGGQASADGHRDGPRWLATIAGAMLPLKTQTSPIPHSALASFPPSTKQRRGSRGASWPRVHARSLLCACLLRSSRARGLAPGQDLAEEAAALGTPLTSAGHLPSRSKASKPPLSLSSSTVLQDTMGGRGVLLIVCRWSREREASRMFWRF